MAAAVAAVVAVALPAGAARLEQHGWWWRAQAGLLLADLPPPPDVPEGGIAVELAPDGANAVAAVRYRLEAGETDPVLVLTPASEQGEAAVDACPAAAFWSPARAGVWDERPAPDCDAGRVAGERADDGGFRWPLSALVRDGGVLDVVLVPAGSAPFRVTFEAPTDRSLETTRETPSFAPPPVPPPLASDGGSSRTAPPPSVGGSFEAPRFAPAEPPPVTAPPPLTDPAEEPPPLAAPPAAPALAAPTAGPVPVAGAGSPSAGTVGALLAALAGVFGLGLSREQAPPRRKLGPLARREHDAATVGGLGRFARPRDLAPRSLR